MNFPRLFSLFSINARKLCITYRAGICGLHYMSIGQRWPAVRADGICNSGK